MANTTITDLTAGEITNDNDCFVMDTSEGVTVKITYAELVEALQNVFVDQDTYTTGMNGKQNTLTFDTEPKSGSSNPVSSGGLSNYMSNNYYKRSDYVDTVSELYVPILTRGVYQALGNRTQLVTDNTPTQNSINFMTSGGIYTTLQQYVLGTTFGEAINTKQNKVIQSGSITIPASGWSNNENVVACEHTVTNRNIIDIPTDEFTTWGDKGVYAYSETATTITFKCSETPTTDLHCKLTSMEVDTNVS